MLSLYKKIASSIQAKHLVTFLLLITALSIIIIVSSYTLTSQSVKTQVGKSFSLLMNNISDNILQEIKRVHSLCDFIFISDEIKTAILSKGNSMEWENSYNAYFQIKQYVMSNPSEYVNSITITGFNGFNLSYGINYIGSMPEWSVDIYNIRKKVTDANGRIVWSDLRKIPLFPQNKNSVIVDELSVYRIIKDKQYRENIGIVNISANPRLFSQYIDDIKDNTEFDGVNYNVFLINHNGKIISSTDEKMNSFAIKNILHSTEAYHDEGLYIKKENSIAFAKHIPVNNWVLVGVVRFPPLISQKIYAWNMILISFALSVIVCGIVYIYLSKGIFSRVKGFCEEIKQIGLTNSKKRMSAVYPDEIGQLATSLNQMLDQIEDLNKRNIENEIKLRDSIYQVRQSQMNPHFIYNTLNSIRWMAIMIDAQNIVKVIDAFWKVAKYVSDVSMYRVKVRDEVDIVNEYVYLQKFCYPDQFEFFINVDQNVLDCECIKFILQPLIENAIIHGIYPKKEKSNIFVNIYSENNSLIMSVYDNGIGINQTTINHILAMECNDGKRRLGIRNIVERLKIIYGDSAELTITSHPGSYTKVMIRQPIRHLHIKSDDFHNEYIDRKKAFNGVKYGD
jgi:two-component system sensor histidine kinase YesM